MLIIFAVLATTAFALPQSRIVNGQNSNHGQWPWQVSLRYTGSHICGGVLIGADVVLTAAHCVEHAGPSNINNYNVVLGDHKLNHSDGTEQSVGIGVIRMHNNYNKGNGNFPNDIAIIKLAQSANLNSNYISTVDIPSYSGQDFQNLDCVISGWGLTSANGQLADTLQHAEMRVISNAECKISWGTKIIDSHICLSATTSSACNGDSGGPLVCNVNGKYILAGLTSWGNPTCFSYPNVYTRISSFLNWISSNSA